MAYHLSITIFLTLIGFGLLQATSIPNFSRAPWIPNDQRMTFNNLEDYARELNIPEPPKVLSPAVQAQNPTFIVQKINQLQQQFTDLSNQLKTNFAELNNKLDATTKQVTDVDTNLNLLLGKSSVMSNQYTDLKQSLTDSLTDMRNSLKFIKEHTPNDAGPN